MNRSLFCSTSSTFTWVGLCHLFNAIFGTAIKREKFWCKIFLVPKQMTVGISDEVITSVFA
ncbi:MAG: hypothetical protein KGI28_10145 [Thaumarchaeota archaeon]|nr:hypothetical protein [Nitrososphaerota archaeon]